MSSISLPLQNLPFLPCPTHAPSSKRNKLQSDPALGRPPCLSLNSPTPTPRTRHPPIFKERKLRRASRLVPPPVPTERRPSNRNLAAQAPLTFLSFHLENPNLQPRDLSHSSCPATRRTSLHHYHSDLLQPSNLSFLLISLLRCKMSNKTWWTIPCL